MAAIKIVAPRVITANSTIAISGRTHPRAAVAITVHLSTTVVTARKIVVYVRPAHKRPSPHAAMAKDGPACHRGVKGCVAKTVIKRAHRTVALYRTTVRAHADHKGYLSMRVRLAYAPRKTMHATLTVTVKMPHGTVTHRARVKVAPRTAHPHGRPPKG